MKTISFRSHLKRSALARIGVFALGLAMMGLGAGCVSVWEGLAEAPYEKAMKQGRMSPTEFMKEREKIERAAEPVK